MKHYLESTERPFRRYLIDDLEMINRSIRKYMEQHGIDVLKKEQLWGTALALVKVSATGIEFIQTGDCMILGVYQNDCIRLLSRLQVEHLESEAIEKWKEGIHQGIKTRNELYKMVKDILISNRYQSNTPNGYGVLNGEEKALDFVEYGKINRLGLKHIILLTDGLFLPKEIVPKGVNYWDYVANSILDVGIEEYAKSLINLERTDPECLNYPRFKVSDDKTGLVINF